MSYGYRKVDLGNLLAQYIFQLSEGENEVFNL
jgi:hypothetical protein